MIEKGIKELMRKIRVTGFTINIGFIGLDISGGGVPKRICHIMKSV
jgi:hypothetical protein